MDIAKARTRMEKTFPGLLKVGYDPRSDEAPEYNCIAWAAGKDDQWWEPSTGYYWPKGIEKIDSVEALIQVFQGLGYTVCDDGEPETGFEKIAIFSDDDAYTHAARQLEDGRWTSKIGEWEDIEHNSCDGLEGKECGKIAHFMKRPKI